MFIHESTEISKLTIKMPSILSKIERMFVVAPLTYQCLQSDMKIQLNVEKYITQINCHIKLHFSNYAHLPRHSETAS